MFRHSLSSPHAEAVVVDGSGGVAGLTQRYRNAKAVRYATWLQGVWGLVVLAFLLGGQSASVFAAPASNPFAGTWTGELGGGDAKLHLVLKVTQLSGGEHTANVTVVEQGGSFSADALSMKDGAIRFEIKPVKGVYQGKLSAGNGEIVGTWEQSGVPSQPLSFKRGNEAEVAQDAKPSGPTSKPFTLPLEVRVPVPPTAFNAAGKAHLVYELQVTNGGPWDSVLSGLEVVDGDNDARVLASFTQADLEGMMQRKAAEKTRLEGEKTAVVYVWVTLDRLQDAPAKLRHRLKVKLGDYPELLTLQTQTIPVAQNSLVISPPLSGDRWVAANGPSNASGHRRARIPIDGHAGIAQRFAIDWVQVGKDNKTHRGDPADNKNYYCFGVDALAVADGVVAAVLDGIPNNVPGINSRAQPITLTNVGGNFVQLDIGNGRYAFYAHLQPGSLRVKVGDKVRRGQVVGLVGNTGNSTEPHLHFHISDSPAALSAEGYPYALPSFEVKGAVELEGDQIKVQDKSGKAEVRTMSIPADGEVVNFGK